jgi:hypothetical protein
LWTEPARCTVDWFPLKEQSGACGRFLRGAPLGGPARPLLELVLNLVQPGAGTGFVEIASRRPGGANRSDHLVTHFDDDASAEQQQMRQFEEVASTGTVFDLSTSAVVSVLNDAEV